MDQPFKIWGPGVRSALIFIFGFLLCFSVEPALADKRVALVIGMSRYQQVPRLANPARDAEAMTALFKKAGFDVVNNQRDLGISDLRRVIREFSEVSRDADISVSISRVMASRSTGLTTWCRRMRNC